MSKRAEESALKAYPPTYTTVKRHAKRVQSKLVDTHKPVRAIFQQGFEQAEKDLMEWVEEQLTILDKQTLLHPDDDVFWGQRNAYKQMKDKLNSL